jgi:hypothetical protein
MNKLKRTKITPKFETISESRLLSFLKKPEPIPESSPEPFVIEEAPIAAQEGGSKTPGKNKKVKKPVVKRPRAKPAKISHNLDNKININNISYSKDEIALIQNDILNSFK